MVKNSRSRLIRLVRRDHRPNAWRRRQDVVELLSQFSNQFAGLGRLHGRYIPYTMPAVEAVHEALLEGTIQQALVPQVIHNAFIRALDENARRVTPSIIRMAIYEALHPPPTN